MAATDHSETFPPVPGLWFLCLTLLLILVTPIPGLAARPQYTRTTFIATYDDITAGGAAILEFGNPDDGTASILLPFSFPFAGVNWTTNDYLSVTTNGYAYLSSMNSSGSSDYNNLNLYGTSGPTHVMAPWWDDLDIGAVGTNPPGFVAWKVEGVVGSRSLIVQWTNVSSYTTTVFNQPAVLNFQLNLEETTNAMEFRYAPVTNLPGNLLESASIGIKAGQGEWIDAVTGSDAVSNSMLSSRNWPGRFFRFTPGDPSPLAAGTYTVGSGSDYPCLSDAVADLNQRGVSGPVVFQLADTLYDNTTNILPLLLGPIVGTSASNTILIEPAGASAVIQSGGASDGNCGTASAPLAIDEFSEPVLGLIGSDFVHLRNLVLRGSNSHLVERGLLVMNASDTDGASDNDFEGLTIGLSLFNSNALGVLQEAYHAPTTEAGTNSRNVYRNLTIVRAAAGIHLKGNAARPDRECVVAGEGGLWTVIGAPAPDNITATGTTWGVRATAQADPEIHHIDVSNVTGSSDVTGIWLENSGTSVIGVGIAEIHDNRVHGLSGTSSGIVRGLRLMLPAGAGSATRAWNNLVYGLTSSASTSNRHVIGIALQDGGGGAGATHQIDFNSVHLQPSTSCSNTTFEIGTVTGPVIRVRNNIFGNFTGTQSGTRKHYCWVTPSTTSIGPAGSVSDHNILFVANAGNGRVGLAGGVDLVKISDWRTVTTGLDAQSTTYNPGYLSNTDLHIDPGLATPVESAGSWMGGDMGWAGTDIDAELRNATTPDVGADEGGFIPWPDPDASAVAVLAPTGLKPGGAILSPAASFSNPGLYSITGLTVRFTITGPSPAVTEIYNRTAVIASLSPGDVKNVTFPDTTITTGGDYTLRARAELPGDLNPANDEVQLVMSIAEKLSGIYAVGVAQPPPFNSLSDAFDRLNFAGVSGHVVFELTDSVYARSPHRFPIDLQVIQGAGPDATFTLRPAPGVQTVISTYPSFGALYMFKLNGTDYVTIDGSNNGTSSRDLTITNVGNLQFWAICVWLSSQGPGQGCTNNVIKNCRMSSLLPHLDYRSHTMGIHSSGLPAHTDEESGYDNDYNQFLNNEFSQLAWGIFLNGAPSNLNDGNVISGNVFGVNGFGTTQIGKGGIMLNDQNNVVVTGNDIGFVGPPDNQDPNSADRCGIGLGERFWPPVYPRLCTNAIVTGNRIHDIVESGRQSAVGILLGEKTGSSGNIIANNMIYSVTSNGTAGHQAVGIAVGGAASGDVVAFNSIRMAGSMDGSSLDATESACGIRIGSGSSTNLTVKNNVISMDVVSNDPGLNHFAIVAPATAYSFDSGGFDHNDYFPNPGNPQAVLGGIGTSAPYSPVATLTGWGGLFTPVQDQASMSVEPPFASDTDLHLQLVPTPLFEAGVPIGGITVDIDGQPRDAGTPDIGADEVPGSSGAPAEAAITGTFLAPATPNPFPSRTTLGFALEREGRARLDVLDVQGRLVRTLVDAPLHSGHHDVTWDGTDENGRRVASGCYILRLDADGRLRSRTVYFVK